MTRITESVTLSKANFGSEISVRACRYSARFQSKHIFTLRYKILISYINSHTGAFSTPAVEAGAACVLPSISPGLSQVPGRDLSLLQGVTTHGQAPQAGVCSCERAQAELTELKSVPGLPARPPPPDFPFPQQSFLAGAGSARQAARAWCPDRTGEGCWPTSQKRGVASRDPHPQLRTSIYQGQPRLLLRSFRLTPPVRKTVTLACNQHL